MTNVIFSSIKETFKQKEMKKQKGYSLKKREDYEIILGKAFDDAFNQYARRNNKLYANNKQELMKPVIELLFRYFNEECVKFNDCYNSSIEEAMKILDNYSYGIAQKFVNMSFKYLYCFDDADEFIGGFEECHMPLDKYTLNWVKTLGNKDINEAMKKINFAWTNIDKDLYNKIQEFIENTLKNDYKYKVISTNFKMDITLPKNKLQAEFIIWNQEKINEITMKIKKLNKSYEELCIKLE